MKYMTRIILYPLLLLAILLCSCTEHKPLQARYEAEKMYHDAENSLNDAKVLNPNLSNEQLKQIINKFESLVDFCYTQLDQIDSGSFPLEYNEFNYITFEAVIRLSQLHYLNKDFDACIQITNKLLTQISMPIDQKAIVYVNLGQALQSTINWDSAYAVYDNALELFSPPITSSSEIIASIFNLPLYILKVVQYTNVENQYSFEMTKAENYYLNLIRDYPGSKLEAPSRANLAKLYELTGQWNKELAQLKLLTSSKSKSYFSVLLKTADIYAAKLKRYDTALTLYDLMIEKTTENKDDIIPVLLYKKSLVHIAQGKYELARSLLYEIKDKYLITYNDSPLFQYNLARSFDLENKWNRAEQEYNLLFTKFKGSSESMTTLLYLVEHFREKQNSIEKERWFKTAESYYIDIAQSNKGTIDEANALLFSANLYMNNKDYEQTLDALTVISTKFPDSEQSRQALLKSIHIYRNVLDQPQKADSLLAQLRLSLAKNRNLSDSEDLLEN